MRKNDEEYFLAEYLINNKDNLEKSLGIRIKELNLVEKKRNKKIEINGEGEDDERIFLIIDLDNNYGKNIARIQDCLALAKQGEQNIIIYIATKFEESFIKEGMEDVVFFSENDIELVFLDFNKKLLKKSKYMDGNGEEEKRDGELKLLERIFLEKRGMKVYNRKF